MGRKPTGKPPGRPPKTAKVAEALQRAEQTGESLEDAARAAGVAASTVHAHKARAATKGAAASRSPAPPPSSPPDPPSPPAGSQVAALPQGGAVSGKPDLLELVREILDARIPAARAELDEGLRVFHRGDAEAFAAWKLRPVEREELDGDELDVLREGLAFAVKVARTAEPGGPLLRALATVERMGKSVSVVAARRPAEPKPNEVDERVRGAADTCVAHLLRHTRARAAKFQRDRQELRAWAEQNLGPVLGPEVVRRVEAMLGGAPS